MHKGTCIKDWWGLVSPNGTLGSCVVVFDAPEPLNVSRSPLREINFCTKCFSVHVQESTNWWALPSSHCQRGSSLEQERGPPTLDFIHRFATVDPLELIFTSFFYGPGISYQTWTACDLISSINIWTIDYGSMVFRCGSFVLYSGSSIFTYLHCSSLGCLVTSQFPHHLIREHFAFNEKLQSVFWKTLLPSKRPTSK